MNFFSALYRKHLYLFAVITIALFFALNPGRGATTSTVNPFKEYDGRVLSAVSKGGHLRGVLKLSAGKDALLVDYAFFVKDGGIVDIGTEEYFVNLRISEKEEKYGKTSIIPVYCSPEKFVKDPFRYGAEDYLCKNIVSTSVFVAKARFSVNSYEDLLSLEALEIYNNSSPNYMVRDYLLAIFE